MLQVFYRFKIKLKIKRIAMNFSGLSIFTGGSHRDEFSYEKIGQLLTRSSEPKQQLHAYQTILF